jgi:4-amino-4-deoxy-L-arabinose transferase-like glycosyltransferase
MEAAREEPRIPAPVLFAVIFSVLLVTHFPLLRLPYFWDEAGYYIPAARDLWLSGSLIPHSSPSNAHPPLVMAYLALCWKLAGYSPMVTRTAMLVVSAFALMGIFRLAQRIANTEVAISSAACTAIYPVFFSQSSMAHVDLAAAAFIFWGLLAYVSDRKMLSAGWFALAALAKETAILVSAALFTWEVAKPFLFRTRRATLESVALLLPALPLGLWYAYHYSQTGYVFGNPEFFRYNVQGTLQPLRIVLALLMRLWQTFGYMSLHLLTAATILAMWRRARPQAGGTERRPRIAIETQLAFLAVAIVYMLAMAVIGGAVLARYMLPIVPLVIILWTSTLWRRIEMWKAVVSIVGAAFVISLFVNPPYGFSIEDNLAYRDYIVLHQRAEAYLEARYPMARVLTAWPANDEVARPTLGYVTRPLRVLRIEDFTAEQLTSAADLRSGFDVALVFSTKYEPRHSLLENWPAWQRTKARFFGYHHDVPPAVAAQILGGEIVYNENRNGQWIAVIETQQIREARKH